MSERLAPAETYKLNTLASVLGRYAVLNPDKKTLGQVSGMLEATADDIRQYDVPEVPHSNPVLLEEAASFDYKLLGQLEYGPASDYLTRSQHKVTTAILRRHLDYCESALSKSPSWQRFITHDSIAAAYGIANLWSEPDKVIQDEIERWGYSTTHPIVPEVLNEKVSLDITNNLMGLMWEDVIGLENLPVVDSYLTDDKQNYHVFWAPLADKLDYATPRDYNFATQLSFDLPHNATHLAHLDTMDRSPGASAYDDSMKLRAYFEAVTVLSEKKTIEVAEEKPEFIERMANILGVTETMGASALKRWIIEDRKYEFKLRAARYAGDTLMLDGVSFEDAREEISKKFGITNTDAANEIRKYLAWTGLGAVYTYGYRQLESQGVVNIMDAIKSIDGQAITTWPDFYSQNPSS